MGLRPAPRWPHLELVDSVEAMGDPMHAARRWPTEASMAWYAGQPVVCAALASRAPCALKNSPHPEPLGLVEAVLALADPRQRLRSPRPRGQPPGPRR